MSMASSLEGARGQVPPQCLVTTGRLENVAQLRKLFLHQAGGASISSRAQTLISALIFRGNRGLLAFG